MATRLDGGYTTGRYVVVVIKSYKTALSNMEHRTKVLLVHLHTLLLSDPLGAFVDFIDAAPELTEGDRWN